MNLRRATQPPAARDRPLINVATCGDIEIMRAIGIQELKNKLSHFIRLVEADETVLVTNGGTVVAELRPPAPRSGPPLSGELEELARRGLATPGAANDPSLYPSQERLLPPGTLEKLLDEERGD